MQRNGERGGESLLSARHGFSIERCKNNGDVAVHVEPLAKWHVIAKRSPRNTVPVLVTGKQRPIAN